MISGQETLLITENMSVERNTKHRIKVIYQARNAEDFQRAIFLAKQMFGHGGKENGWWWGVQGKFRDRTLVFKFNRQVDANLFKVCL